jgi:uncharacterized protein (DUF2141 family)
MNKIISMNKRIIVLFGIILCCNTDGYSQTGKIMGTLTFHVTGLSDTTGQVMVQLFRKEDQVPKNLFMTVHAEIINMKAVVVFEHLAYGDYAAIVVHDKNTNGKIDHRWGIPNEPLGFTNNWHLSLFSGMPTFDKLKFTFNEENQICNIHMRE